MSDPSAVPPAPIPHALRGQAPRLSPGLAAASAALAVLAGASSAAAQVDARWQAGASAQIGITDNAGQTPDPLPGEESQREADGFTILSPTIALILEAESSSHTFAYGFGATLFFTHPEANSYSNGVSYVSRYELNPTTDLALGAAAAYTQTGAFTLLGDANATDVAAQPAQQVDVISVGVNEGIEVALSEVWTANQTIGGTAIFQVGQPTRTYLIAASVGAAREFTYDTLGMSAGSELLLQPPTDPTTNDEGVEVPGAPGNTQLILRVTGTWNHALSERWSTTLAVGGLAAFQLGEAFDENDVPLSPPPVLQPYGLAAIDYNDEIGTAGFQVEHTVAPNVLTGSAQLTDTATLRAGMPLGQDSGFAISATGAGGMARTLDIDGTFGPRFLLLVGDAGVSYAVPSLPELSFDLRYQVTKQVAANPDDPAVAAAGLQALTRHTGLFGVAMTFPPADQGGGVAAAAVFRPTPTGSEDILAPAREARERREREEEEGERRDPDRDTDGQYGPSGAGG